MLRVISILFLCASAIGQPFSFHDPAWPTSSANSSIPVFNDVAEVWHFDDTLSTRASTAVFNSANNLLDSLNGTFQGYSTNGVTGVANHACAFPIQDITDGAQAPDNSTTSAGSGVSFTYTFWFMDLGGSLPGNPLISKWNNSAPPQNEYICIWVKPAGLSWGAHSLAGVQVFVTTNNPSSGVWHFGAMGYDDSLQQIFMQIDNGARINAAIVGVTNGTASFAVFNYSDSATGLAHSWKGSLDELYLWKRALSTSEVATLWNGGSGTFYTFVWEERYWAFDRWYRKTEL